MISVYNRATSRVAQVKISPFFKLSTFFLVQKQLIFHWFNWQSIQRMKIKSFQKIIWLNLWNCKRNHLKYNARMKKINILQFSKRTKNYISSIEPLILIVNYTVTNEILVSRGILRPVRQKSGDTNFTASPHTHFLP